MHDRGLDRSPRGMLNQIFNLTQYIIGIVNQQFIRNDQYQKVKHSFSRAVEYKEKNLLKNFSIVYITQMRIS